MMNKILLYILSISFFLTSTLSAQTITKDELRPGDILMYNGKSFISKAIMFFDGGDYSHTGIYDGENVLEAVSSGVNSYSLPQSVKDVNYVDVYRRKDLDSAQMENISSVINKYKYFGERYSYEQFMLLAVLTITRKAPVEFIAPVVRTLLDRSGTVFTDMIADGKQPMICSELVYRCFAEADTTGSITLSIPTTKIQRGSLSDIAMTLALQYLDNASEDMSGELKQLKSELKKFKSDYSKTDPSVDMDWTEADFVTPSDLQNSPSLVKLGRLTLD